MQSKSSYTDKTNIFEITILRVMATILVVVFHSICYYGIWDDFFGNHNIHYYSTAATWLNFVNMPLFVFMSGYIFAYGFYKGKYNDKRSFILNKVKRLLVPFIFWGCVNSLLFSSFCKFSLFSSFLHLWFLEMLFGVFIFAILSTRLWNHKKPLITILFFVTSLLSLNFINLIPNYFNIRNVFKFLPLFLLGVIMVKYNLRNWLNFKAAFGLIVFAILIVLPLQHNLDNCFLSILFSIPMCLLLFLFVSICSPDTNENLWGEIAKSSMGIYITHHIIMWCIILYLPGFEDFALSHYILTPLFLFFFSFSLSYFITHYARKIKVLRYILG